MDAQAMLFLIYLCVAVLYIMPTVAASLRNHRQAVPIFLLNILLGWTLVGWAAALIWAFVEERPAERRN